MLWNVTVYSNTGLTTANTIDKPARLANARQTVLPQVNIVSAQGLSSLRVCATFEQLENVDYLAIQSGNYTYFYSVSGAAVPAAEDAWILPITMDAVMTAAYRLNGIEHVEILDGIVERHHVNKADDTFGAYTEEDPLLIPSKELEYDSVMMYDDTDDEQHVIVESTLSLSTMAQSNTAVTYLDGTSGESVPVPQVAAVTGNTRVTFGDSASGNTYQTPGTQYYDYSVSDVQDGISRCRALGVEDGVLNSYIIPDSDATFVPTQTGEIQTMQGAYDANTCGLYYERAAQVQNNRLNYGSLNMYELISPANGMRMTFKPEDLKLGDEGTSPTVIKAIDPRPNGRPYYRFKYYKGLDENHDGFFPNAIAGMEWANAPLIYNRASGSTLNQIKYDTTMHEANRRLSDLEQAANVARAVGMVNAVTGGVSGMSIPDAYNVNGGDPMDVFGGQSARWGDYRAAQRAAGKNLALGAADAGLNIAGGMLTAQVAYQVAEQNLTREYELTAKRELQNLAIGNSVVAPQVNFPRSESIRDFMGNGVVVIKYQPQTSDIAKLDKILTMYGYKDTKALESSDFTGRAKFNYVKAQGVQIGGDIPKWLREALAAQLSAGVRIWHQLPDTAAYTDGSNV